jgi:hypothetical protein
MEVLMFSIGRAVATLMCGALATTVLCQDPTPAKPPAATPAAAAKTQVFVVARVGDKLEVIAKDEVAARKKKLADEHTKAMEKFDKDKKAAEAAKKPFDTLAPKEVKLEVTPGEYASQALADSALKKLKADEEKAAKEKADKEKADKEKKGKEPPKDPKK